MNKRGAINEDCSLSNFFFNTFVASHATLFSHFHSSIYNWYFSLSCNCTHLHAKKKSVIYLCFFFARRIGSKHFAKSTKMKQEQMECGEMNPLVSLPITLIDLKYISALKKRFWWAPPPELSIPIFFLLCLPHALHYRMTHILLWWEFDADIYI